MLCHLYFSRCKLFKYEYVDIAKPNVLYLNKYFFLLFFNIMHGGSYIMNGGKLHNAWMAVNFMQGAG